uniref:FecR family protein n=1 Tax=uncultured Thiotrichaceae bacterium TaxID=298394 RepID=A0A6S6TK98_9GAMM|nr:MAG: FecR family protein [uncultured Thiotrichaceae bacterium]
MEIRMLNKQFLLAVSMAILSSGSFLDVAFAAEEPLGKTILARGSVTADRNSAKEALKRLSPVFQQDVLRSGSGARAQFRMVDDALINLQENSVLNLKEYKLDSADGNGSVLMDLISGGLRTVTGVVGKKDKKDYQLRTPTATIGIRGTMYEVGIVSDGMYVGAWSGDIWIRSHSGKCDVELGDNFKNRFAFVDVQGICRMLQGVPKVFREGYSSDSETDVSNTSFSLDPLLENPQRELPYRGITLGQRGLAIGSGQANSITSSRPVIETSDNGTVSSPNGTVTAFTQSVGGYQLSWGRWNDYALSPELDGLPSPVEDEDGLIWSVYQPSDTDVVTGRAGEVRYDNMVDSLSQSTMGTVSNLAVQMDVNFNDGSVTNGTLSAQVPDHTWVAIFDGQVNNGQLDLDYNGGALANAQTGALTDASGQIIGDFVGDTAEAITGGFSMTDNINNNQINGTFLVEQE